MNLYLMHTDIIVAELTLMGGYMHIIRIINNDHMPLGVKDVNPDVMDQRLARWLEERCIPKTQPNYKMLLSKAGVSSITEMPTKSYMCAITDCYWFKSIQDKASWTDVNFFDNGFDETAGKVTLKGDNMVEITDWNFPELTTNGCLPKRWFQGPNGEFYLLKAGTPPDYKEVYNEAFAYQCAMIFGLDAVPYAVYHDAENGLDYSVCPSFIQSDREEFISLEQIRISLGGSKQAALDYLYQIGLGDDVEAIRGFDYLIRNTDRHFGNIGVIRDSSTLQIKRLAPLFDHGFSMDIPQVTEKHGAYLQKLTEKTGNEELTDLKKLGWTLTSEITPADIMRRARETYQDLYTRPDLMRLTNDIGRRLYDLQHHAEALQNEEHLFHTYRGGNE